MKNTRRILNDSKAELIFLLTMIVGISLISPASSWAARRRQSTAPQKVSPNARVVYPEKTDLDFEGLALEGEVRNPGEFYFQHRPEEKFDSLVKRRKNFQREMLRDVVLSK